ncbi:MAG TPA: hypothetical protein VK956_06250 [Verrucomicrobium sp.]|nr:hypothetical protein [Verrucomicrobium sp.]
MVAMVGCGSVFAAEPTPLFRESTGINGHTVNFKPDLYQPVCRVVRDYHPVEWDLKDDTSKLPEWPFAKNRVSWEKIYKSWHEKGLQISVCLLFDNMKVTAWKNLEKDAEAYARSFAENFGPGGKWPYVEYMEIGNEPGLYEDATYVTLFKAMTKGIREGNPKMKIVTCNVEGTKSDRYWKGADLFKDLGNQYDVLQIHRYAISEQWPVWKRTYPENPKVPYLSSIQELLHWRDTNAKGKPVWVTEFGWDASSKEPDPKGEWAKWKDSTDEEQARWLVRSFFLFAEMGVEKSFVYFFNDEDEPKLHAASGLTRNFQPKPAYHAVAWMLKSLENYRFSKVIQKSLDQGYVFEFTPEKAGEPVIWAVWHPTQENYAVKLDLAGRKVLRQERMPLAADSADQVMPATLPESEVKAGERPILLWLQAAGS